MNNIEINSADRFDQIKKLLNDSLSLFVQADFISGDYKDIIGEIKLNLVAALGLVSSSKEADFFSVSINSADAIMLETDGEVIKALAELLESSIAKAVEYFETAVQFPSVNKEDVKAAVETGALKNGGSGEREILLTFIDECGEHIQAAEDSLLKLEADPSDRPALNDLFRSFHTIKGSAHFLNLKNISEFAHAAEDFFSEIRDGKIEFNKVNLELAFRAVDELKVFIVGVKSSGGDCDTPDAQALIGEFKKAAIALNVEVLNEADADKKVIRDLDLIATAIMQTEPDDINAFTGFKRSLEEAAQNCKDDIAASVIEAAAAQIEEIITAVSDDSFKTISIIGAMIESCVTHLECRRTGVKSTIEKSTAVKSKKIKINHASDAAVSTAKQTAPPLNVGQPDGDLPEISLTPINISFEFDSESIDREMFLTFIDECLEHIQASEEALLNLENNVEDAAAVNVVFRAFHTVKGSSSFLGLAGVTEFAHHAESLLVKIRDKEIKYTKCIADVCLRSVDMLKTLITLLKHGEYKKPDNYDELLRILMSPELKKGVVPEYGPVKKVRPMIQPELSAAVQSQAPIHVKVSETPPSNPAPEKSEVRKIVSTVADEEESTVRVKIARIDKLIDMVGELVISHSMVAQDDAMVNGANHLLAKKVMQSGKIIRELQDLSMTMRMIPFRATFQKMARVVRDISGKNGKTIDFITSGKETEVDRNLVDIINDALMHMVRNSVDHGIEPSDVRKKAGKPEKGRVVLSAFHSGGNVVIEVKDDGKGLDRTKIIKKAIEKGIIKSEENMTDADVFNLIFMPGFSTAEQITDISGRGVGMDVVKTSIESLRGRIDISSIPGNGCCFSIKVPLTLAVTDGMLIKSGDQRYIIPTANIYLTFRPRIEDIFTMAGRGEMVMLHQKMIPVFRLHKIFNINGAVENPWDALFVVIDDGDNKHCAVLVDELLGQQQIVAKPLGIALGKIEGISGGAILGDGKVGLIIDTKEIVNIARQAAGVCVRQTV